MAIADDAWEFILEAAGGEKQLLHSISYVFIVWASILVVLLQVTEAPYGRYLRSDFGFAVNANIAWVVQELPSFVVPIYLVLFTECPRWSELPNRILLGLFLLHYFQRTFIFGTLIKGGKPLPCFWFVVAIISCMVNGYVQARYILSYADLGSNWALNPCFYAGTVAFLSGMFINIHSDNILRNLRKQGETGYKIPEGGMFQYVSGANFMGEILEWWGFALASRTLPSFTIAIFTMCNIGPRACHHHRWYQEKFEDYPKTRKALIPFML